LDRTWRDAFLAYAQMPEHRQAVREAEEIIACALASCRRPYVAFSGGKDSTCLLHLVLQQAPDVMVLHWDFGRAFVPWPIEREVLRNARLLGARHLRVETSPLYARLGRRARGVLGRHLIGRLVPKLKEEGYDLAFVGLREEESLRRRRRIRAGRSIGAIQECWPLASWRWLDVWAYIVSHRLPYLSIYDDLARLVGYQRARFTTLFDPEMAPYGAEAVEGVALWRFKHADADA